jgi:hypothetical protein
MEEIMKYRIFMTPGLVIDEEVVCAGRVPTQAEMRELIGKAVKKGG